MCPRAQLALQPAELQRKLHAVQKLVRKLRADPAAAPPPELAVRFATPVQLRQRAKRIFRRRSIATRASRHASNTAAKASVAAEAAAADRAEDDHHTGAGGDVGSASAAGQRGGAPSHAALTSIRASASASAAAAKAAKAAKAAEVSDDDDDDDDRDYNDTHRLPARFHAWRDKLYDAEKLLHQLLGEMLRPLEVHTVALTT